VTAAVLALTTGRRAVAGVAVTTGVLLVTSLWAMPGSVEAFATRAPELAHRRHTEHPYNWGRQVTFQSFWRLLLQGHVRGETAVAVKLTTAASSMMLAAALGTAAWLAVRDRSWPDARGGLIAAAVTCTPLLVPYYMDYDLLLLAVPAVLFAADRTGRSIDRWQTGAWVGLFIAVTVGPLVASTTRFHPVVPVLAIVAAVSVARCLRRPPKADTIRPPECEPAALAA
jgi:hypothetical protein